MKRIHTAALLLALLLLLSSCGTSLAGTGETGETLPASPETQTAAETEPDLSIPVIRRTLKKSDFEALPVANGEMTNEQLRQLCVEYYRMMGEIRWTLSADLDYEYPSTSAGAYHLKKYQKYGGMPYTRACGGLADFLDFYDDETGLLDLSRYGSGIAGVIGNNCATSVFWAWARVTGTVDFTTTQFMTEKYGCLRVGPYTYAGSVEAFADENSTRSICDANGEKVMYESYAALLPGDGTVKYETGADHHARLVMEAPVVVRNADGSIDPDKSYVVCSEQGGSARPESTEEDGTVGFIIRRRSEYTFRKLFSEGSLPVTVAELAGTKKVEAASILLDCEPEDLASLSGATLTTNYPISRLTFTLKGENGDTAYETVSYSDAYETKYEMKLSKVVRAAALKKAVETGKTYSAEVLVRLGNGETLTVWKGEIAV